MLNEALRLVRSFHDLSLTEMSERLGVSKSYLSEIENGHKNPTLDLLQRYSTKLDIPLSHLMLFAENYEEPGRVARIRKAVAGKAMAMLAWVERMTEDAEAK